MIIALWIAVGVLFVIVCWLVWAVKNLMAAALVSMTKQMEHSGWHNELYGATTTEAP